jgi:CHAT domain-containing protein/tetratricopeptide (TPR) repeat protein
MGKLRRWRFFYAALLAALIFGAAGGSQAQTKEMMELMGRITALGQEGRLREVIPLARRLVAEAERTSGANSKITALALVTLASSLQMQGELTEAEALFKRIVVMREKTLGPQHPDVATPLTSLGQIAATRADLSGAEAYLKRALTIREAALDPDHQDIAMTRMTLGGLRFRQGRNSEALTLFELALKSFQAALGPDSLPVATALNNIAEVHRSEGRLAEAEDNYRHALAIQEKLFGADTIYVAPMLSNLGELYRAQGRLPDAEAFARRVLQIREKALGPDHADLAGSLSNLAIVFSREGRAPEAEGLLRRSLAIFEKAYGRDHPDVATATGNLAEALSAQGRQREAEALFRRALEIRERKFGAEDLSVAISLSNLVALMIEENRSAEAEPLARRALAIHDARLDKSHPLVAHTLNALAVVLDQEGKHDEADPLLKRALDIRMEAFGDRHPDTAVSLHNLAFHHFDLRSWKLAYDTFKRASEIWVARSRSQAEGRQSDSAEIRSNADPFAGQIAAAYRLIEEGQSPHDLSAAAFEAAQWIGDQRSANAVSEMSARFSARDSGLAALIRERQDLDEQVQAADRALIAAASKTGFERSPEMEAALRVRANELLNRVKELDRSIAQKYPDYAAFLLGGPVSIQSAQSLLREQEALLLFTLASKHIYVWTITKNEARWREAPIGLQELKDKAASLRCGLDWSLWEASNTPCPALLDLPAPAQGEPLPFDFEKAHELFAALFGPVADVIEGKELILVPSGPLATLPFHVLLTEKPSTRFSNKAADYAQAPWFAKRYATAVMPSVASLKALRTYAKASLASRPFIGFGNPLLDGNPSNPLDAEGAARSRARQQCPVSSESLSWGQRGRGRGVVSPLTGGAADLIQLRAQTPLPETADEICAVANSFSSDRDVLLGANMTKKAIQDLNREGKLADYRVIHFATHGALAGQVRGSIEPGLICTPPSQPTQGDDGYLAASDIAGLKLDADWVVLSACNTAGAEKPGAEAFSGLSRAFFYAGARALLVSHWAVESNAAVKLVTEAVASLRRDGQVSRAEALRRAMLSLIADRSAISMAHPSVWAPFIVVGQSPL